ncbi:MAG: 5-methyltetrahydropteroyltriglutamate--homocysteine S-methyltransferase [Alphaproteobacteria bacterium]
MTRNTKPTFRADHVGSLLRPAELAAKRQQWRDGEVTSDELRRSEDAAIRDVVALQEGVGLKGVTDGEFRRDFWHLDFMWALDGVEPSPDEFKAAFSGGENFVARAAMIVGKVAYPEAGVMRDAFRFLHDATKQTAKITIPSPSMFRHRSGRKVISAEVYPDLDVFWDDLGQAYNDAMRDFASMGCRYLQLDDVNSANLCDLSVREAIRGQGEEPDRLLARYIKANNAAVAGRPDDMFVTTHMCRGNFRSEWISQGGYEAIAERLLAETDVDGFFMEYDSDRAGDFAPLRFVPKGRKVVLGLITSKTPTLESKDELKRRIDEAGKYIDLDQLCISPQCGFSSTHHGNKLSQAEEIAKLNLVVEVARDVWGEA